MPVNPARLGGLRTVRYLCILTVLVLGYSLAQPQAPAKDKGDPNPWHGEPKTWPYNQRLLSRAFGNVGGWWSFMNENDKAAFLDGYQRAMSVSLLQSQNLCEVLMDREKHSSDQHVSTNEIVAAIFVCGQISNFTDFEKITTKDLDDFYSDPVNQPIMLDWSMVYLRDKASGRKTEGQLLDALKAEQKEIHDCSKYPGLCKLGIQETQSPH